MATIGHFCLLFIFLFPLHSTRGEQSCDSMSCGEIDIQFPFGLKGAANQGHRCSYPGFQLSCDNQSQTLLTLRDSRDLVIKNINYETRTLQVNDPEGCLPKRYLHNLSYSLSLSPFMFDAAVYELYNVTFLRCPSNVTELHSVTSISCLSEPSSSHKGNSNSSSVILMALWWRPSISVSLSECEVMSSARVPIPNTVPWPFWPDLTSDIELMWNKPRCGDCATHSQVCGFTMDTSLQVGCLSSPSESQGLPRSAKFGLTLGVAIPGLLCIIGLSCFICSKLKMDTHRHRPRTELPNPALIIDLQPAPFIMGLDGPEIDKFPKTLIGDSGRLPKSNDNTCPICLSEYEPKETLRTIPECNHYFHAHCIDEWLKMNATCPLCRNSPDASSTSSLSVSSSLSSST